MYKVYSSSRGIEFKRGVRSKILMAFGIAGAVLFVIYFNQILEVMIAGF